MGQQKTSNDAEGSDITRRRTLKRTGLTAVGAITGLGVAVDSTRAAPNVGSISIGDIDLGGSDRYTGGWGPQTPTIDARYSLTPDSSIAPPANTYDYAFKKINPCIEYLGYSSDPDTTTTHWFAFSLVSHTWMGNDRYHTGRGLREQTGCKLVTDSPDHVDIAIKPAYQYAGFIDGSTVPRWEEVVNGTEPISKYEDEAQQQIPSDDGFDDALASISATAYEEVLNTVGSPVGLATTVFKELAEDETCGTTKIGNRYTDEVGRKWDWCHEGMTYPVPLQYLNSIVGFELPYSSSQTQVSVEVGTSIRDRVNDNFGDSNYERATSYQWDLDLPGDESEARKSDYHYK